MRTKLSRVLPSEWDIWLPLGVVAVFIAAAVVMVAVGFSFGIPEGDVERIHILYTEIGVQTTAGIFAIIISLSLMAIQFAAQEYSHRIMEYYLRSTVFWTTIVVYLTVITSGIVLQAQASSNDDVRAAALLLVATMLALALLIPHFLVTAAYLKPEFVVGKLIRRLDQGYVRGVARRGVPTPDAGRLLPIVELIERSIDRGDLTTMRGALERVQATYARVGAPEHDAIVDHYFLDGLLRAGRKAISQADEQQAAVLAIRTISAMRREQNASMVVDALEELGFGALRRDAPVAVGEMISATAEIAEQAKDMDLRARVMTSYAELGQRLVRADQRRLLRQLTGIVVLAGIEAAERKEVTRAQGSIGLLEELGHDSAEARMSQVVMDVGKGLQQLGTAIADVDPAAAQAVVLALLRVERTIPRHERDLLGVIEFARADLERLVGAATAPRAAVDGADGDAPTDGDVADAPGGATANDDPLGLADLWAGSKD
jgi:hypothetical protein